MRIAFCDMGFSWPPPGGAQVDLHHTMSALQRSGYDVRLFAPVYEDLWRHGHFDPAALPYPATPLPFVWEKVTAQRLCRAFRRAIDDWRPDVAFVGFGRYFKPHLIHALNGYPIICRYYMYEHLCLRNFWLFLEGQTCPNDYLRTPNVCRACALDLWGPHLSTGEWTPYGSELLRSGALTPGYHSVFTRALSKCRVVIVNNAMAVERVRDFCPYACVVPGGVTLSDYDPYVPLEEKAPNERKVILMSGRADDPLKGLDVLVHACAALAEWRSDFVVWVTGLDDPVGKPWYKPRGWLDPEGVRDLYRQADIVAIPSVWDEPYGLVAVEAMAAGRPVVASRVGGLQHIVRPGETGHLFERESSAGLALLLNRLLDDPGELRRMGRRSREIAEAEYDWRRIVDTHYPPLLERALQ